MTARKIALFIDADNISAKFGKQILDLLETRGEIFIRRIYGNWEKIALHGWNNCILNYSMRPVQQNDFATGKNATDMSLTIDAMDVLYGGKAEVFALVSNDSDFTPLAIRLREGGVNVIGLGNAHVSNAFRSACNEFILLDAPAKGQVAQDALKPPPKPSIAQKSATVQTLKPTPKSIAQKTATVQTLKPPKEEKLPPIQLSLFDEEFSPEVKSSKVISIAEGDRDKKLRQIHDTLREAAAINADTAGFTPLCLAGDLIRNKNLGFGVKNLGYGSLNKFVAAYPDIYELIQRDNGENFCYRCRTDAPAPVDKLEQLHTILREVARTNGDKAGFSLLNCAGKALKNEKLDFGVKDFGYSTLQKFISNFPALYELQKIGTIVRYRCR